MFSSTIRKPAVTFVRDQIMSAAYPLFAQHGSGALRLGEIARSAGVTRREFDREFPSRSALAAECLAKQEHDWVFGLIEAGCYAVGGSPQHRLLGIFDVFSEWFNRTDFDACTFARVTLGGAVGPGLDHAANDYQTNLLTLMSDLAAAAQLRNQATFVFSLRLLISGVIASAARGDGAAPVLAKSMARDLISRHRGGASPMPQVELAVPASALSADAGASFDPDFDSLSEPRLEGDVDPGSPFTNNIRIAEVSNHDFSTGTASPTSLSNSEPEADNYFWGYL